jgi:CBS-domain-containing membrane protein
MTREVTTLKRNEKLTLADDLMKLGRIRHLPVVDDKAEQLVGIVSQRDLFHGALVRALGYGQHFARAYWRIVLAMGQPRPTWDMNPVYAAYRSHVGN